MSIRRKTLLYLPSLKYKSVTFPYILTSILLQSITAMIEPPTQDSDGFCCCMYYLTKYICVCYTQIYIYCSIVQRKLHLRLSWFGSIHSLHFTIVLHLLLRHSHPPIRATLCLAPSQRCDEGSHFTEPEWWQMCVCVCVRACVWWCQQ